MTPVRIGVAFATLLVVPPFLPGIAFAKQKPASAKKVAFLVGVNKYEKRNFQDLDYAEADVQALASALQKLGFETTVLTGSATGERRATRKNIEARLLERLRGVSRDDIVLVVLNGHGI